MPFSSLILCSGALDYFFFFFGVKEMWQSLHMVIHLSSSPGRNCTTYPFSPMFVTLRISFSAVQPSSGNETKTSWEIEVNAAIQPATDTGVLFALVTEEASVPLSLSLIDYHSTKKVKQQVQTSAFF